MQDGGFYTWIFDGIHGGVVACQQSTVLELTQVRKGGKIIPAKMDDIF